MNGKRAGSVFSGQVPKQAPQQLNFLSAHVCADRQEQVQKTRLTI